MFVGCRVRDFSIHDILAPTAKRVRHLFSAVLNYLKFKEEFQRPAMEIKSESEQLLSEHQELRARNELLEAKVQSLQ